METKYCEFRCIQGFGEGGQFEGEGEDNDVGRFGWNATREPEVPQIPQQSLTLAEYGNMV